LAAELVQLLHLASSPGTIDTPRSTSISLAHITPTGIFLAALLSSASCLSPRLPRRPHLLLWSPGLDSLQTLARSHHGTTYRRYRRELSLLRFLLWPLHDRYDVTTSILATPPTLYDSRDLASCYGHQHLEQTGFSRNRRWALSNWTWSSSARDMSPTLSRMSATTNSPHSSPPSVGTPNTSGHDFHAFLPYASAFEGGRPQCLSCVTPTAYTSRGAERRSSYPALDHWIHEMAWFLTSSLPTSDQLMSNVPSRCHRR
jgi:hypothetical protein